MTPRYGNPDLVQFEIVEALRATGCSVQILSGVGGGCPDLLIARSGITIVAECKTGKNAELRETQELWRDKWKAHVYVVRTIDEALDAMSDAVRKQGGG